MRISLFITFMMLFTQAVFARPILTEEGTTLGKLQFETEASISQRFDKFGFPRNKYETVVFPVKFKLGLFERFDFGFTLKHISQKLETGKSRFTGSQSGLFSPEFKYGFSEFSSVLVKWHVGSAEEGNDNLPVGQGNDYEILFLRTFPTAWPLHVNLGYVVRGDYDSELGVDSPKDSEVDPGNIFEVTAAVEIPLLAHFNLIHEWAYYEVQESAINGTEVIDSSGEALDTLVGLSWGYGGWNIGAGVGFGLLNESHTSFNLERGSGDYKWEFFLAYKLKPRRPGS